MNGDITVLPTQDCLSSSNFRFGCCNLFSYSQVASFFCTPSFAPSALLWFYTIIFFSCNFSCGTHLLQFCFPKIKEMWIVHMDIYCNITINTKRINQILKTNFVQIIFTSIFWKPFLNFHPFLLLYNSLKLVLSYRNLILLIFQENLRYNHHAFFYTTLITIILSNGD